MTIVSRAETLLADHRRTVEEAMDRLLPGTDPRTSIIVEAMRYSLFAGGKRLRPGLVLATSDVLGGARGNALPSACAVEMIHTYSLIHDDLPSMDDDDLRRGRPTNHVQFGEGTAILAGDALSNAAFFVIAEHTRDRDIVGPLVRELAFAAGTEGMIGGQVLDMLSMGTEPALDTVDAIHRMKTAALIRGSVRLGAVAARADATTFDRVDEFGRCIGLAFQIIDDVLDVIGDAETLGKTAGKDEAQLKMTYPACIGIDRSRQAAQDLVDRGIDGLGGIDTRGELAEIARFICSRLA